MAKDKYVAILVSDSYVYSTNDDSANDMLSRMARRYFDNNTAVEVFCTTLDGCKDDDFGMMVKAYNYFVSEFDGDDEIVAMYKISECLYSESEEEMGRKE